MIGESAIQTVCSGTGSRRDAMRAEDYLRYVADNMGPGEINSFLSAETLVQCSRHDTEGAVRNAVLEMVFDFGSEEQIGDLVRALPDPRAFCINRRPLYSAEENVRISAACERLGLPNETG